MHDSLFTISTVVEQSLPFCVIVVLVGEYGDSIFETGVLIGEYGDSIFETGVLVGEYGDSILWDGRLGW